jgi:hypothetical protein
MKPYLKYDWPVMVIWNIMGHPPAKNPWNIMGHPPAKNP